MYLFVISAIEMGIAMACTLGFLFVVTVLPRKFVLSMIIALLAAATVLSVCRPAFPSFAFWESGPPSGDVGTVDTKTATVVGEWAFLVCGNTASELSLQAYTDLGRAGGRLPQGCTANKGIKYDTPSGRMEPGYYDPVNDVGDKPVQATTTGIK